MFASTCNEVISAVKKRDCYQGVGKVGARVVGNRFTNRYEVL